MSNVIVVAQAPISIHKTEATLMEVTTVSGGVAVSTAALDVGGYAHGCVLIDHAWLDTGASGVIGARYAIEVSEQASGAAGWRAYTSFNTGLLTPGFAVTPATGTNCIPGATTISLASALGYTATERVFLKNLVNFAKSEWAEVVFGASGVSLNLRDGLTNTQQSSHIFGKAEQYVTFLRLDDILRIRVAVNNALYTTTNKAIAFQARAILGNA